MKPTYSTIFWKLILIQVRSWARVFQSTYKSKWFDPKLAKQLNTLLDTSFIIIICCKYLCITNHHYNNTLRPCNSRSTITRSRLKNTITDQIANCRNRPLSANHDLKKNLQFLNKNYTISRDRELQKWATFCKSRSQEKLYIFSWSRIAEMHHFLQITIVIKLYNFSRKTIQFLVIANCRNGPLSANHDRKKNFTISQEKLYNFSRKNVQFFVIANCRNGPLSANHDLSLQKLTGRTASDNLEKWWYDTGLYNVW